jgi:hypothetical protein
MGALGKDWWRGVGVTVPVTGGGGSYLAWPLFAVALEVALTSCCGAEYVPHTPLRSLGRSTNVSATYNPSDRGLGRRIITMGGSCGCVDVCHVALPCPAWTLESVSAGSFDPRSCPCCRDAVIATSRTD